MHHIITSFWFEEISPSMWWKADDSFDEIIKLRFEHILQQAAQCELQEWRDTPQGRLAEIIVLDQFSRNVFRNTPQSFSQDPAALVLAQEAVRLGVHTMLSEQKRTFLLMPFMHSESQKVHVVAEQLFREFAPSSNYEFELKHKAIIDRFGRYPHRNELLGRPSSPEEIEFLKQPGSSF